MYHKSGSRHNLASPSKLDVSGVNGRATRNGSRQYSAPRNLGLILNPLRVLEHELSTVTKSRHPSRLNLDKALDENQDLPPPEIKTHQGVKEPLSGKGNYVVLPSPQTNGAFFPKHARTLKDDKPAPFL